jgi:hypothetical protein
MPSGQWEGGDSQTSHLPRRVLGAKSHPKKNKFGLGGQLSIPQGGLERRLPSKDPSTKMGVGFPTPVVVIKYVKNSKFFLYTHFSHTFTQKSTYTTSEMDSIDNFSLGHHWTHPWNPHGFKFTPLRTHITKPIPSQAHVTTLKSPLSYAYTHNFPHLFISTA